MATWWLGLGLTLIEPAYNSLSFVTTARCDPCVFSCCPQNAKPSSSSAALSSASRFQTPSLIHRQPSCVHRFQLGWSDSVEQRVFYLHETQGVPEQAQSQSNDSFQPLSRLQCLRGGRTMCEIKCKQTPCCDSNGWDKLGYRWQHGGWVWG